MDTEAARKKISSAGASGYIIKAYAKHRVEIVSKGLSFDG